jgi:hypothetical protein
MLQTRGTTAGEADEISRPSTTDQRPGLTGEEDRFARIVRLAAESEETWSSAYSGFDHLIDRLGLRRGAEVGVAFGGHAEAILKATDVELLIGIDPYRHLRGYDDPMNLPQADFDALHRFVCQRLEPFGTRYRLLRQPSPRAARFVREPLDFVYLDARHTLVHVWQDLCGWFPTLRSGGVLAGHDYGHVQFPGVTAAVDEFARRRDLEVRLEGDGVWWCSVK